MNHKLLRLACSDGSVCNQCGMEIPSETLLACGYRLTTDIFPGCPGPLPCPALSLQEPSRRWEAPTEGELRQGINQILLNIGIGGPIPTITEPCICFAGRSRECKVHK